MAALVYLGEHDPAAGDDSERPHVWSEVLCSMFEGVEPHVIEAVLAVRTPRLGLGAVARVPPRGLN